MCVVVRNVCVYVGRLVRMYVCVYPWFPYRSFPFVVGHGIEHILGEGSVVPFLFLLFYLYYKLRKASTDVSLTFSAFSTMIVKRL